MNVSDDALGRARTLLAHLDVRFRRCMQQLARLEQARRDADTELALAQQELRRHQREHALLEPAYREAVRQNGQPATSSSPSSR